MSINFQKNVTSISDMMEKEQEASTSTSVTYTVSTIPTFIQNEAEQWGVNLQAEVNSMNALLARDNFFVNVSDKLVEGLRRRLMVNPPEDSDHTAKTTQFGLMYYLYLAIEKLYFQSSTDNFTEKLFGTDPFAEKLAIIRILWDIFCKWYIESTNDTYSKKLEEIDQVMTKERLNTDDFNVFKQIFEPGLMLGFIIWLKAYFTPLLRSDTQVMLKTKEIIDGKNDAYMKIIEGNNDIEDNYKAACKELEKISDEGESKSEEQTPTTDSAPAPTERKKINMNAAMIATYYMGSVLAYIHKSDPTQYQNLFKEVEKLYNIRNSGTDVAAIKAIFAIISNQNKGINFGEEDRILLSKQIMEGDVLTGEASSTVFVSIVNIYLRIKNFLKSVVVGEEETDDTHHGDPIHLIKGLASSRGLRLESSSDTAGQSGGVGNNKENIINNSVHMLNQGKVLEKLIKKVNELINNVPVKYLTHFNVSNMPKFKQLNGENYVIVAVTEDSERVIPILWIRYEKGNKTMAQIYLVKNKHETKKVYDLSFDPTGDASILIGTIDIIKGKTPNSGYGKFTFDSSLFSDINIDYLNPDDISQLRKGNIYSATLTKNSLSEIISDLSLEMHFVSQKEMIYTLNANMTFQNGGKKSFLLANVEDKEPIKNKPDLFGSVVKGNAADLKLCDQFLGQFMDLANVQAAESFLAPDRYVAYPKPLNDTFAIVLDENYINNGGLNYNVATLPLFLHFLFLLRYNPSEFRSLKSTIKHSFTNVFQKQGKIVDLDPTNNSAISKLRQPGCAQTLADLIRDINNAFKSTKGVTNFSDGSLGRVVAGVAAAAAGGAKKAVKRIAKKMASKRGRGRGRGRGRSRGRGRGRGGRH